MLLLSLLFVLGCTGCYSQQESLPEPENITANFATSTSILWSWDIPSTANFTGYMIYCRVERSKVIFTNDTGIRNILCQDLKPYTVYVFFLSLIDDDPDTNTRRYSKPGFNTGRTNSAAPGVARNLNVTLDEENNILIATWETPEDWNGVLDGHIIKVKNSYGDVIYETTKKGFNNRLDLDLSLTVSEYYDVSIQYFNVDQNTGVDLFGEIVTDRNK